MAFRLAAFTNSVPASAASIASRSPGGGPPCACDAPASVSDKSSPRTTRSGPRRGAEGGASG